MSEQPDDMRAFLLVVRRALLMIVAYIEQRYDLHTGGIDKRPH